MNANLIKFLLSLIVCGGILTEPDGIIASPNYPSDYGPSDCTWKIKSKMGSTIQITFNEFRIANLTEHCSDDYLLVTKLTFLIKVELFYIHG